MHLCLLRALQMTQHSCHVLLYLVGLQSSISVSFCTLASADHREDQADVVQKQRKPILPCVFSGFPPLACALHPSIDLTAPRLPIGQCKSAVWVRNETVLHHLTATSPPALPI